MRLKKIALTLASAISCFGCAQPSDMSSAGLAAQDQVRPFIAAFPVLAPGQTEYTVQAYDTPKRYNLVQLPDNFTLKFNVPSVDWQVDTLQFGKNTTIDLRTPQLIAAKPSKPPTPSQAGYCRGGDGGRGGIGGTPGLRGTDMTMFGIQQVNSTGGGLWIRTDGNNGSPAGDGGDGGQGGGKQGGFGCGALGGGPGGLPGATAPGGRVSSVTLTQASGIAVPAFTGTAPRCGTSTRPTQTNDTAGAIAVYGAPGCPGAPGARGRQGPGG